MTVSSTKTNSSLGNTGSNEESQIDDHHHREECENLQKGTFFQWFQVLFLLCSILSYMVDTTLDIVVACFLYQDGKMWNFGLTVTFVVIPTLTITFFSLRWYIADYNIPESPKPSRVVWVVRVVLLLTLFGPVIRYVDSLRYLILYWKARDYSESFKYYKWMIYENADAELLRLFEAFLEAAPQSLLQIYIISGTGDHSPTTVKAQIVSCVLSLISISWALSSQQRTMRISQSNAMNPTYCATIIQALWFFFMTSSRMVTLGLFASVFPATLAVVCAVRWIIMTIWLKTMKTNFCDTKFEEFCYNCVLGFIYLFCYLNPSNSRTRWRYVFFYLYTLIENSVLIGVWYYTVGPDTWYRLTAILIVFLSFFIGIFFMLVYYLELHPTGAIEVYNWRFTRGSAHPEREDSFQTKQDNKMIEIPDHFDDSSKPQPRHSYSLENVDLNSKEDLTETSTTAEIVTYV